MTYIWIKKIFPVFLVFLFFISISTARLSAMNIDHGNCSNCHSLHNAPGQTLTTYGVAEDLCLTCHGPLGTATKKAEVHTNKSGSNYSAFSMTCIKCHNAHDNRDNHLGSTNIAQVGRKYGGNMYTRIPTPNSGDLDVVFISRGTDVSEPALKSFADGDTTYDGVCEVCHTQALNHRNDGSGNSDHYKGQTCTTCHPHDGGFIATGGGSCSACHSAIFNTEFAQTSHHVYVGAGATTVSEDDCIVCHLEPGTNHMDGNINLKNPDTGAAIIPFLKGSVRDTTNATIQPWVTDLQNNFCMKCHDANGANGDTTPFSSGNTPANVSGQFSVSNSYHHAVSGPVGNPFCNANTMEAPWNTAGDKIITCFDCHETTGHGSSNQKMLRTSIDINAMENLALDVGIGVTVETFCTLCHKDSVYGSNGDGASLSKFEYHGGDMGQHGAGGGNELGCMGCHGGIRNESEVVNGFATGNIHGGSFPWPSTTWSTGSSSQFFMVGGWISGWKADTSSGKNGCGGGSCNHPGSTKRNTPGKEYTKTTD